MAIDFNKYDRIDYSKSPVVLSVKDLRVSFKSDSGIVHAVRGVSFDLHREETLCIVGESGSGKSATCKTLMGILSKEAIIEGGSVMFQGEDMTKISEDEFHRIRGNKIGMIFQDPLSALNPIMKIGPQIVETTMVNRNILKRYFENYISKEHTAYKNAITVRDYTIYQLKSEPDFYRTDELSKLDDVLYNLKKDGKSDKEIAEYRKQRESEIKAKYKEIKANNKTKIAEAKQHFKDVEPGLKKDLENKKKEAKKATKQYKAELIKKRDASIKECEVKKSEINKSSLSQEEKNKQIAEIDDEIKKIKYDFESHTKISKAQAKEMALKVMEEVGISQPEERFKQYPFEFSGGMRQRIVIAIALTANPEILICDEPTTALDVTIQAQILDLINKIKAERHMSVIFITHDMGVVARMADRIAVMYAGKIVEIGKVCEIFYEPKHPYTWALLSSIPDVDSKEKLDAIPGTPPNLVNPPVGDAFADRNKYAIGLDYKYEPPFYQVSPTHFAATWLLYEGAPKVEPPAIVTTRIAKALEKEEEYERRGK